MWEVNGTTKGPLTLVSSENDPNSSFIIVLTSNLLTLETYVCILHIIIWSNKK